MSLEISSSSGEDRPHEGIDGEETTSDKNPSISTTLSAGENEASEGSSFEEPL